MISGERSISSSYFRYLLIRVRADVYVVDCAPGQDLDETSLGRKYAMLARGPIHFSAARTHAQEKQAWNLIIILGCFPVYLIHALPFP